MGFGSILSSFAPQIATSVIGGVLGNKGARDDRRAIAAANYANNLGFYDARPYVTDLYKSGKAAKDAAIDMGAYQGETYAGLNPFQTLGFNYLGNMGTDLMGRGADLMNVSGGFGQNFADLYNQSQEDRLANATDYAAANTQPLLAAAMLDPYRQLTEQTLPGINQAASTSNNMNSSRAGVNEALANRAYDDRSARTATAIQDALIGRSLSAQDKQFSDAMAANDALKNTFGIGFGMPTVISGMLTSAGGGLQTDEQNRLNDAFNRYNRNRMDKLDILGQYNANILNRAPTSTNFSQTPNMTNPLMATIGGANAGFGFGGNMFGGGGLNDFLGGLFNPTYGNYMSYANSNN